MCFGGNKQKPVAEPVAVEEKINLPEFKVIVVGHDNCGKTTLLKMLLNGEVDHLNDVTLMSDDYSTEIPIEMENGQKKQVKVSLWDMAGTCNMASLTILYLRNTEAAIFVYGIDDKYSFQKVDPWEELVDEQCPGVLKVLVGNKSDLESER